MVESAAVCLGCVCVWVHKCLMVLTKDHVKYLWNHELWLNHKEMYFFDKQTGNLSYRPMDRYGWILSGRYFSGGQLLLVCYLQTDFAGILAVILGWYVICRRLLVNYRTDFARHITSGEHMVVVAYRTLVIC